LLAVIFLSTLVFHYGIDNETIPDALYRTISLMATGADMGGRELPQGGWQKVFVSVLRLAGGALTAAVTAMLASYPVPPPLGGVHGHPDQLPRPRPAGRRPGGPPYSRGRPRPCLRRGQRWLPLH